MVLPEILPRAAVLLPVLVLSAACVGPRVIAPIGPAPDAGPVLEQRPTSRLKVKLANPGFVTMLMIGVPEQGSHLPVTFTPRYPLYPTDQKRFDAGSHTLRPRQRERFAPLECGEGALPSLTGCRRSAHLQPGLRQWLGTNERMGGGAVLMIVSDTFVDPYTLAEQLYWDLFEDWRLTARLRDGEMEQLSDELEPVLLERLGTSGWSGVLEITWGQK